MCDLAAHGYDGLSIERVAELAQTGKASIYRRWPTKLELAMDAIETHMPSLGTPPDTGAVRDDLMVVLKRIARHMNSRAGGVMRLCMTDLKSHVELAGAIRERLIAPRKQVMLDVLNRGVERGEVRPNALTDRIIELGPKLLHAERIERGRSLRDADVVAIIDEVLMPILRPAAQ
jgi:AcrR family transcriptional regulator